MAYVRTFSFVVPPERASELQAGHNLYMATVSGTQIVAQNTRGYLRGGVWTRARTDGSTRVIIFTQWDGVSDMQKYIDTPMIRDYEADVARYHRDVTTEVYEAVTG